MRRKILMIFGWFVFCLSVVVPSFAQETHTITTVDDVGVAYLGFPFSDNDEAQTSVEHIQQTQERSNPRTKTSTLTPYRYNSALRLRDAGVSMFIASVAGAVVGAGLLIAGQLTAIVPFTTGGASLAGIAGGVFVPALVMWTIGEVQLLQ